MEIAVIKVTLRAGPHQHRSSAPILLYQTGQQLLGRFLCVEGKSEMWQINTLIPGTPALLESSPGSCIPALPASGGSAGARGLCPTGQDSAPHPPCVQPRLELPPSPADCPDCPLPAQVILSPVVSVVLFFPRPCHECSDCSSP